MEREYLQDTVSVIIPVYNAGKFLDRTLNSIFAQTYKNVEIVLVDDCSKDNSAEIIKKYQETHPEIVYHLQETNQGAAVARNTALELAKGRYVAFLDSDDMWYPDKLEKQLALMKEKDAAFCFAAIEMVNNDDEVVKKKRKVKEKINYRFLLHNTMIATSSVVVDREKKGDFRMPLRRGGQDYATWLMLMRDGTVAYGINEALVKYRVGNKSLSSNKFKSIKQVWQIQTQNEKICKFKAFFHVIGFTWNALIKYLF
ncbi:MAG: glycosyltransferase family 2 protein [Clostridiales bacterium]|nr:glycosyltransferase family 2 protein [Clostridiales bacterium]